MSPLVARLLVFGSSAVILVLEILAGRLMAPYVGVTLETFTGIIGVVLAGIALGAWLGGRSADRTDPAMLLGPVLIFGGVLVMAAPPIVDVVGPHQRAAGPVEIVVLTASAFLLPAMLLASVTPLVVKLRLQSLDETGRVVGSFSAIGTAGALVGTFVTGFVLLATVPSSVLVLVTGGIVVVAGVALAIRGAAPALAVIGLVVAGLAGGALAAVPRPCDIETVYFCALVEPDPDRSSGRTLWLDTLRHSYVDLDDPTHLEFRYSRIVADVIAELPEGPVTASYIGGGGFTVPRYVAAVRPGSTADVFEIDPELVTLAEGELGLVLDDDLRVEIGDARLRLPDHASDSYDLVLGDAFGGLSVPWHLTTEEFLEEIDRVLRPGGIYVINLLDYPPLGFARAEAATFLRVFDEVAVIAPPDYLSGERGGNYVLVGTTGAMDWDRLQAQITERDGTEIVWAGTNATRFAGDAQVLVVDLAPVDQLISRP